MLLETLGTIAGSVLRRKVEVGPARAFDSAGGLLVGAAAGVAVVWVLGSVALQFPGRPGLRESVQRSVVLQQLNDLVPPAKLMRALARVDPFPAITGPSAPVSAPDPRVLADPSVRQASPSVLKVLGTACGLGVSGSGWVAAPELVVTAAHVVAGQDDTTVEPVGGVPRLRAQAVYFDRRTMSPSCASPDWTPLRCRSQGRAPEPPSRFSASPRAVRSRRAQGGSGRRGRCSRATATATVRSPARSRAFALRCGTATPVDLRSMLRAACRRRSSRRVRAATSATASRRRSCGAPSRARQARCRPATARARRPRRALRRPPGRTASRHSAAVRPAPRPRTSPCGTGGLWSSR